MNKKPISYLQTDAKWKNVAWNGMTVGTAGCGPTSAAMLIATLKDPSVTPDVTYMWAGNHGHLEKGHGTNYTTYFQKQFAEYGLIAKMLSWTNTYGNPNHQNHQMMIDYVKQGYYAIALMGPGTWTSSGHFVVIWWADNKIRINDPASTKEIRLNGDPKTFFFQAKYYWLIDAREYNKEEEEVTQEKFNEMFAVAMKKYRGERQDNDASKWSETARKFCVDRGIFTGDGNGNYSWEDFLTREQCAILLYKLYLECVGLTQALED